MSPVNNCQVNECPVNDCPVNDCPVNDCPVNELTLQFSKNVFNFVMKLLQSAHLHHLRIQLFAKCIQVMRVKVCYLEAFIFCSFIVFVWPE